MSKPDDKVDEDAFIDAHLKAAQKRREKAEKIALEKIRKLKERNESSN